MAIIGRWTGGSTTLIPSTSFTAPNGLFTTEQRNDNSVYSFDSSQSTVTLPTNLEDLADGYLVNAYFRYVDTSNDRFTGNARFLLSSGTGNFLSGLSGGYSRDASEDTLYIRCWAFIDQPSTGASIQFTWARDVEGPTGGTDLSVFEIIPFYYRGIGIAASTATTNFGGTTPNQVTGFSQIGSVRGNISFASNQFQLERNGSRYLCIGSAFLDGPTNRTQRWAGFRLDGTKDDETKSYYYMRENNNNRNGCVFANIYESDGSTTIDMFQYRGDGVGSGQGGASGDNFAISSASYSMVVLQLHEQTEVFRSNTVSQSSTLNITGPVDLDVCENVAIEDTASFSKSNNSAMGINKNMDCLLWSNLSVAQYTVSTGARWTAAGYITRNGAEDTNTGHGNYQRNNQGTWDTFGWSTNPSGYIAVTNGDTVGSSIQELAGGEGGGTNQLPEGWGGFWGINLDTLRKATIVNVS